jgi:hypothetical protein
LELVLQQKLANLPERKGSHIIMKQSERRESERERWRERARGRENVYMSERDRARENNREVGRY